jgi:hypothetical protein
MRSHWRRVGDGVLHDQRLDSFRMRQDHAKADGAAVVLHVKCVARESQGFSELVQYFGVMIERVCKPLRVRPVTMSEAGIIRRDQMEAVG